MAQTRQLPKDCLEGEGDDFTIRADVLALGLGLPEDVLRAAMANGEVASTVERGEGEDDGRYRLTFRYRDRYYCVLVEPDGQPREVVSPLDILQGR